MSKIPFAQNSENQNPYAIFGKTFVLGEEGQNGKPATGEVADAVFVIENSAVDSPVARLEHNTRTGIVKFFDRAGKVVAEKQLTDAERAWLTPDPLAEKYYSFSPYAFCLNNPINAVDPDGKLVIFVNGMHFDGSGGSSKYWNGFDNAAMRQLNDNNSRYYDGSFGGAMSLYGKSSLGPTYSNIDPSIRYNVYYKCELRFKNFKYEYYGSEFSEHKFD